MTSKIISSINRAVCLTLDTRVRYAKELKKLAIDHDIDLQLFIAGDGTKDLKYNHIDGKELPPKMDGSLPEDLYTWNKTPNMYNILLCHQKIMQEAYDSGCEVLLMMEDDAIFADDFDEIMQKADEYFENNNWDIIYLGSYVLDLAAHIRVAPNIYQMIGDNVGGLHGVLLKRSMIELAKDFPPYESMDGLLCHSNLQEKFDMYIIDPSIINQKAGYSCTCGCRSEYKKVMPYKYDSVFGWFTFESLYRQMVDEHDKGIFVELGSYQGRSTIWMAEYLQIENKKEIEFYAVDLWPSKGLLVSPEDHALDMFNEIELAKSDDLPESLYHTFIHNLIRTNTIDTVRIIRETSWLAANIFEDNSVDFVFIDAGHEYDQIKRDIVSWYPKIKDGGVIAGHDYLGFDSIKKAVGELLPRAKAHELDPCSWFYRKNT